MVVFGNSEAELVHHSLYEVVNFETPLAPGGGENKGVDLVILEVVHLSLLLLFSTLSCTVEQVIGGSWANTAQFEVRDCLTFAPMGSPAPRSAGLIEGKLACFLQEIESYADEGEPGSCFEDVPPLRGWSWRSWSAMCGVSRHGGEVN